MASELREAGLGALRELVERRLGLYLDDSREPSLHALLHARSQVLGRSQHEYIAMLTHGRADDEWRTLARELTIGETYFFRNMEQFQALSALLQEQQASTRRVRLLSAACSSGEEAYSLAIVTRPLVLAGWDVSIRAVDVNPLALEKAARAIYSPWALRELPREICDRWFRRQDQGRDYELDGAIRNAVRFEERNLTCDYAELWGAMSYDVIFCRNVLMYFSQAQAARVVERMTHALVPGGHLFLGHAETLRGLSHDFHLRHTHGTFYYQSKRQAETSASELRSTPAPWQAGSAAAVWDSTWMDAVSSATRRIEELTASAPASAPGARATASSSVDPSLEQVMELMRAERFDEALERLRALSAPDMQNAAVLLLRAALLTHQGATEEARLTCEELLEHDELNAGAHYLLALCHERESDLVLAKEHDQSAAYLDSTFAMPRLHLGLIARRAGDRETARRELGLALVLLERDSDARILLFGGGFSRSALVALCRAELLAAGGTP